MSDRIIKIIPQDHNYRAADDKVGQVLKLLRSCVEADNIKVLTYEDPAFIDCGSNLESIECPCCGERLSFDWWGEAMNKASENGFHNLNLLMPCCGKESSLNELQYYFPCGFACVEFDILNIVSVLNEEQLTQIVKLLGSSVRIIDSHL